MSQFFATLEGIILQYWAGLMKGAEKDVGLGSPTTLAKRFRA